jgi:hypothetical protein
MSTRASAARKMRGEESQKRQEGERKRVDSRQSLSAGPALRAGGRSGPEVTGICTPATCCLLPPAGPGIRPGIPRPRSDQRANRLSRVAPRAKAEVLTPLSNKRSQLELCNACRFTKKSAWLTVVGRLRIGQFVGCRPND